MASLKAQTQHEYDIRPLDIISSTETKDMNPKQLHITCWVFSVVVLHWINESNGTTLMNFHIWYLHHTALPLTVLPDAPFQHTLSSFHFSSSKSN